MAYLSGSFSRPASVTLHSAPKPGRMDLIKELQHLLFRQQRATETAQQIIQQINAQPELDALLRDGLYLRLESQRVLMEYCGCRRRFVLQRM